MLATLRETEAARVAQQETEAAQLTDEPSRPGAHKRACTHRLLGKDDVRRHAAGLQKTALCTGTPGKMSEGQEGKR